MFQPHPRAAFPWIDFLNGYEPDSRSFLLCMHGQEVGWFQLPVYEAAPPVTVWRVGATTLMVALIIAYIGFASMGYAAH